MFKLNPEIVMHPDIHIIYYIEVDHTGTSDTRDLSCDETTYYISAGVYNPPKPVMLKNKDRSYFNNDFLGKKRKRK